MKGCTLSTSASDFFKESVANCDSTLSDKYKHCIPHDCNLGPPCALNFGSNNWDRMVTTKHRKQHTDSKKYNIKNVYQKKCSFHKIDHGRSIKMSLEIAT
eukprot:m.131254 g.131254  ORF g.131254 m.131254 type:complete len:100 (+) comp29532_c0_seq1:1276-1575(+)